MITSVSLSTANVPGPSPPVVLDYRQGTQVAWSVTTNSSLATGTFQVQTTYDDFTVTGYSSIYPPTGSATLVSTAAWWVSISSSPYLSFGSSTVDLPQTFTSSTIFPDGASGAFLASPAGLRIYSSAGSSNILTLKVVQA